MWNSNKSDKLNQNRVTLENRIINWQFNYWREKNKSREIFGEKEK